MTSGLDTSVDVADVDETGGIHCPRCDATVANASGTGLWSDNERSFAVCSECMLKIERWTD